MHIIELQRKFQENCNEINSNSSISSKYKPRMAAVEYDTIELLKAGVNPGEISDLLHISPREVTQIEEDDQRRRKFLTTGSLELPRSGAVFTIYQS